MAALLQLKVDPGDYLGALLRLRRRLLQHHQAEACLVSRIPLCYSRLLCIKFDLTLNDIGSAKPATGLFGGGGADTASYTSSFAKPSGGLFGATAAPASTGGGLFGSSASKPAGGLFGATQPKPAFGAGSSFGAGTSAFGASSGGAFGATAPSKSTFTSFARYYLARSSYLRIEPSLFGSSSACLAASAAPQAAPQITQQQADASYIQALSALNEDPYGTKDVR